MAFIWCTLTSVERSFASKTNDNFMIRKLSLAEVGRSASDKLKMPTAKNKTREEKKNEISNAKVEYLDFLS